MKPVVIYGAGAYADVFYYEAIRTKKIEIAGFTVDAPFLNGRDSFHGLPLVDFESCDKIFTPEKNDMLVLCGYVEMRNRRNMFNKAKEKGYSLPNYISPDAIVESGVQMGENNIIFPGALIGHHGSMENGNIIRQNVYLGHEFKLGSHIIISSGATIAGTCKFGDMTFVGVGATIIELRNIGRESLIGAGAVVVKDVEEFSKCVGNPARVLSKHPETGVIIR